MNKTSLNKIATHPLQTAAWGDFRQKWGNTILATKYGQITIHNAPFGFKVATFLKGPKPTSQMIKELKAAARDKGILFIKMEPNTKTDASTVNNLKRWGATSGKTLLYFER